jgi:hypothetical protein
MNRMSRFPSPKASEIRHHQGFYKKFRAAMMNILAFNRKNDLILGQTVFFEHKELCFMPAKIFRSLQ